MGSIVLNGFKIFSHGVFSMKGNAVHALLFSVACPHTIAIRSFDYVGFPTKRIGFPTKRMETSIGSNLGHPCQRCILPFRIICDIILNY